MNFDSYIISETKTSLSMPLAYPPKKLKHIKGFKRFAFTLAETLITLTIIGVVAALTIPTLMNKYTKHTYVVGLKKAYSQLQNAMKMIPITEGCSAGDYDCAIQEMNKKSEIVNGIHGEADAGRTKTYIFSKQFKVQKLCLDIANDCPEIDYIINKEMKDNTSGFITNDGMIFSFSDNNNWDSYIDINGKKGPNKIGRDIFTFYVANIDVNYDGKIVPTGSKLTEAIGAGYWRTSQNCTTEKVNQNQYGTYICTGRVLEEDAMNY